MNDDKIAELFQSFGYEGTGVWWALLEKLAFAEKPIKEAVLKGMLKLTKKHKTLWEFLKSSKLILENNGEIYQKNIEKFCGNYETIRENNSKRKQQQRLNEALIKNVTRDTSKSHTTEENKKEIEIEEKTQDKKNESDEKFLVDENFKEVLKTTFTWFWKIYDKNISEPTCWFHFQKLNIFELDKIRAHLPQYVATTTKQFRKNPLNYLTDKAFNDEIIEKNGNNSRNHPESITAGRYNAGKDSGTPL